MRTPRVIITRRHTGRIFLSLEDCDFAALIWSIRHSAGAHQETPEPMTSPESYSRIVVAIRRFEDQEAA